MTPIYEQDAAATHVTNTLAVTLLKPPMASYYLQLAGLAGHVCHLYCFDDMCNGK